MTKFWFFLIFFCVLPTEFIFSQTPALTLLCEEDPPDQYVNAKGELDGYVYQVVREIQRRIGNKDPIRMVNWSGAYDLAQNQPNVLLFSMNRTKEREKLFQWIGCLLYTSRCV